ncbi:hypothetical protein IT568_05885 [bacterium]|nr:hypothetical protein [bacterium]
MESQIDNENDNINDENISEEKKSKQKIVVVEENAKSIKDEIYNLEFGHIQGEHRNYKGFFIHAKQITELFKSLEILNEDRKTLWKSFKHLCDKVRSEQKESQEKFSVQKESSNQVRDEIIAIIEKASEIGLNATTQSEFDKANNLLIKALVHLKKQNPQLIRIDSKNCWNTWKKVKDEQETRKAKLGQESYDILAKITNTALETAKEGNPHEALKLIKEIRSQIRNAILTRVQYRELNTTLQQVGDIAIGRIKENKEVREEKEKEWLEYQKQKLPALKHRLQKREEELEKLENEIDYLDGLIANYDGNDSTYKDKVESYIFEKEDKIDVVYKDIKNLRSKVKRLDTSLEQESKPQQTQEKNS